MLHVIAFIVIGLVAGYSLASYRKIDTSAYTWPVIGGVVGSLVGGFLWLKIFGVLSFVGKWGSLVFAIVVAVAVCWAVLTRFSAGSSTPSSSSPPPAAS